MEPYQFGMITGDVKDVNVAIGELDTAWVNLNTKFVDCSNIFVFKSGNLIQQGSHQI